MRKVFKKIMTIGLLSIITSLASAATLDKIVAVVNDNVITQSQLNQQTAIFRQQMQFTHTPALSPAVLREKVLNHMIDTQLQIELAKKAGVTVDDNSVTQAITHIAQQNGMTLAQLQSKVTQQGMNYDSYRAEIKKQMIISNLQQREVAPRVKISEQEVTDFLQQNGKHFLAPPTAPAQAAQPTQYRVRDILIPFPDTATPQQINDALQEAKTILGKLRSGVTVSVESNDLGWRSLKDLPDIFVPVVKNMPTGAISDPIKAPNGYHIIQLVGVQGGAPAASNNPFTTQQYATHARHILIRTNPLTPDSEAEIRLVRIRDAIVHGADFGKMAQTDSQDPGSAAKGGDLGWVDPGMLDPNFEKVMNGLKIGEISEPFKSAFGWHIVQVLERKSIAGNQNFLRNQARAVLYQRKFEETLQNWLAQLRSQSYIKIMD